MECLYKLQLQREAPDAQRGQEENERCLLDDGQSREDVCRHRLCFHFEVDFLSWNLRRINRISIGNGTVNFLYLPDPQGEE